MPVPVRDPSESSAPPRPERGASGRFLEGHKGLPGYNRPHNKAVVRMLVLQVLSLPQIRYVDTGRVKPNGKPIRRREVRRLAGLHDLIDRLQEMFRDPDPANRKHILRFLELAHALFDDAAGTSGGPQRITQFMYAKDAAGPWAGASERAAAVPSPTPVGGDHEGRACAAHDAGHGRVGRGPRTADGHAHGDVCPNAARGGPSA